MEESNNAFAEFDSFYRKKEEEFKRQQTKRITAKQAQYNQDMDLWETNRMLTSGVAQRTEVDLDHMDDDQNRIRLLVRDLKPPFLDGKIMFTKQLEAIQSVRDPTSDLALIARNGSKIVKEKREQRERQKVLY